MKVVKESYICDVCGHEFDESALHSIHVPAFVERETEYGVNGGPFTDRDVHEVKVDVCPECLMRITPIVYRAGFYRPQQVGDIRFVGEGELATAGR